MQIAIIGAGSVGTALGNAWIKLGHEISFGVRDPESVKARALAQQFPTAVFFRTAKLQTMRKLSSWPLHGKAPKRLFGVAETFEAKQSLIVLIR
jgi:pyrroline-5-carboxylate reductase